MLKCEFLLNFVTLTFPALILKGITPKSYMRLTTALKTAANGYGEGVVHDANVQRQMAAKTLRLRARLKILHFLDRTLQLNENERMKR